MAGAAVISALNFNNIMLLLKRGDTISVTVSDEENASEDARNRITYVTVK